jgi:hypothetical protein
MPGKIPNIGKYPEVGVDMCLDLGPRPNMRELKYMAPSNPFFHKTPSDHAAPAGVCFVS